MGKAFPPPVPLPLMPWIAEQALFFVATSTSSSRINVSPKSGRQFRVLLPEAMQVAYLDFTGSGHETAAHLQADGRITIMLVALKGPPRILRFFGRGVYLSRRQCGEELVAMFDKEDAEDPGFRGIVVVQLERISTSCGYSIPIFDVDPVPRYTLREHALKLGVDGMVAYRKEKNCLSIDNLPGFQALEAPEELPLRVELKDGFLFTYDYTKANPIAHLIFSFHRHRTYSSLSFRSILAALLLPLSTFCLGCVVTFSVLQKKQVSNNF